MVEYCPLLVYCYYQLYFDLGVIFGLFIVGRKKMNEEINNDDLSPDEQTTGNNPNPEPEIESQKPDLDDDHKSSHWGRTVWVWVSTILILSVGSGLAYGWFFIQKKLAPQVEKNLTAAFDRPINLGQVEQFTLNGLRFGATEVPSTPTDPDKVTIQAIQVNFDPLLFLTSRTLKLDLTLIQPSLYVEQNDQKEWISTQVSQKEGPIKIDLQRVKVENAEVILVPRGKDGKLAQPVPFSLKTGNLALSNENQQILLNLNGGFSAQDEFKVSAKTGLTAQDYQISLNTKNVDLPTVSRLVSLPVTVETGKLNSSLEIEGKAEKISAITGIAQVQSLNTIIPQLTQPLKETNLELKFRGKEARIVRFTSLFGQIPTIASGVIDLEKGWNVTAATDFSLKDLFNTLKVKKLPVNMTGGLNVVANITGALDKPEIKAEIKNNQPLLIDKVNVKEFKSGAVINQEKIILNDLKIVPILGGNITGKGEIKLTDKKEVKIDLVADKIPAGAIAILYQPKLAIPIGLFNGKGSITGTLNKPENLALNANGNVQVARGTILLNNLKVSQGKWQANLEAKGLQAQQLLTRIEQKVPQGVVNGKFKLGGNLSDLGIKGITLSGTGNLSTNSGNINLSNLTLKNGEIVANLNAVNVNVNSLLSLSRPLAYQEPINGQFNLRTNVSNLQNIGFSGTTNIAGGSVRIEGQLAEQELTGTIYTANLKTNNISPKLPDALLTSNFSFTGSLNNLNIAGISGNGGGKLQINDGTILIDGIVKSGEFIGTVNTTGVQLNKLIPQIPSGVLNSKFKLQSNLTNLTPEKLIAKAEGEIRLGGGIVTVNGNVQEGQLVANVNTNQVQVNQVLPQLPPGKLNSQINVQTNISDFNLTDINGQGAANLASLGGQININNLSLNEGKWQGNVIASGVEVAKLPQIPPQLTKLGGKIGGEFLLAGDLEQLNLNGVLATGEGNVNIAGGEISATEVALNEGKFQAIITSEGVQLTQINANLEGNLNGQVALTGDVNNLKPSAIKVQGNVNLTQGLPLIDEEITASVDWDGKTLTTKTEAGEILKLDGFANLNFQKQGLETVENIDFDVVASNINLAEIPLPFSETIKENLSQNDQEFLRGKGSFVGKIAGNPTKADIQGNVSLTNFGLPALNFDEKLNGAVAMSPEGAIKLNLTGVNDVIELSLASNYKPENFFVKVKGMEIRGETEDDILRMTTNDISLDFLKTVALTYSLPINPALKQDSETGFVAESFTGNISGKLEVNWPSLTAKKSWPLFDAEANIKDLDVQQLLVALEFFELSDFNRGLARPVYANSQALYKSEDDSPPLMAPLMAVDSEKTIYDQLNRLSEITAFLRRQKRQREEDTNIPELTELEGKLNVNLTASNTAELGFLAQLDLDGGTSQSPWRWGSYTAQKVALESTFKDGMLSINPLRIELNDSLIEISSKFGETNIADVKLGNISLDLIDKFVKIPPFVNFGGGINANVRLQDFPDNLEAIGAININNATINQTPIKSANGSFTYQNSRLDFLMSGILSEQGDPLVMAGTFPLQLPIGKQPTSDELLLNVSVTNQGLSLINLLTRNQVNWIDGQGDLEVEVTGRFNQGKGGLSQLRAEGEAIVENATITASALPMETITNVQGKILFDFDNVQVEELTGQLEQGEIKATGNLSLYRPSIQENPLSVSLDQLTINLKSLYQGGVQGDILVKGTALQPKLSGNLELFNGQVFLPDAQPGGPVSVNNEEGFEFIYDNLQLNLTRNIQITKQPLLNFLAKGDLILTGTQNQPILEGEIDLLRGQVNLFTSQFLLQSGYDNKALFIPSNGLDPYLDVLLKTSAPETSRQGTPRDPFSAEIADIPKTDVGDLQIVRIEASVQGLASEITENITLTSSPSRSESEIVSLLGGRFIDTFEGGDTTLGLANLASSALLSKLQNIIGNALGLSEFRLFPASINDEYSEDSGSSRGSNFGLGAEIAFDIGRQFSFSVLKVVNTSQPFEYGIRYRISDDLLFRGSTDLFSDSKATLEYVIKF
jgi:translocation and assembly module TamB